MAKAIRLYSGYNSYGREVEVAQSSDGFWFSREKCWNGFRNNWSKWERHSTPTHPVKIKCKVECANAPEYVDIPDAEREQRIDFGFTTLNLAPKPYYVRLPNTSDLDLKKKKMK